MGENNALLQIIIKNWTLNEFLTSWDQEIDDYILEYWALEISPLIRDKYDRKWKEFESDLRLLHSHPSYLFFDGTTYRTWFPQYVIIEGGKSFSLLETKSFEDLFIIFFQDGKSKLVTPVSIQTLSSEVIVGDYTSMSIISSLKAGKILDIFGYPFELSISPLTEMINGYLFLDSNESTVIIGQGLTPDGTRIEAKVFDPDSLVVIGAILAYNKDRWSVSEL